MHRIFLVIFFVTAFGAVPALGQQASAEPARVPQNTPKALPGESAADQLADSTESDQAAPGGDASENTELQTENDNAGVDRPVVVDDGGASADDRRIVDDSDADAFAEEVEEDEDSLKIEADVMEWQRDQAAFAAQGNVRMSWGKSVVTGDAALGWVDRREVYVEGNVRLLTPDREVQCQKAFLNWTTGQFVFEDFKFRSRNKENTVTWYVATPLGMRLSDGTVVTKEATVSNCDYAVPHHYLRVNKVIVRPDNRIVIKGVSYYVRGVPMPIYIPVLPLPSRHPNFDLQTGNSSSFGTFGYVSSSIDLPVGFDASVNAGVGYYAKRGFAYGLGAKYRASSLKRGELSFFTVPKDHGEDFEGVPLGKKHRYRYQWFHSMDSPQGWEFDLELQKYSDAGFRREFFESEYYNDKPIENRIYLKRSANNWAGFLEGKLRLNEYLDQTERLPYAGVKGFSQPLFWGLLWDSSTEFGFLRNRLSKIRRRPGESDAAYEARREEWNAFQDMPPITAEELTGSDRTVFRFDTRQQISRPFSFRNFRIEPFVGAQATWYDEQLNDNANTWRSQAFYGARLTTALERYFGTTSRRFGINGIRHLVLPEIAYIAKTQTWGATADDLIQFDETDALRQEDHVLMRMRNKFQTRRNGRIIDMLDFDLETKYYPHSERDNNGERYAPLRMDARSRIIDGVILRARADYDFSDSGTGLDFFNAGAGFDFAERWSAYAGHTYEKGYDSYGTYSLAYHLTPMWTAVGSYERDWSAGKSLEERLELVRDFHAFNLSIILKNDERTDEQSVAVGLSPKSLKVRPKPGSFVKELQEMRDDSE